MGFRLPLPDLLATKNGRLAAFFLLYMTEGIPLGFTATAIGTQMRRQGLSPEVIGVFVGSLYLPWAFKWIAGPFVDTFSSDRFGRRRLWIFLMQLGMAATLLVAWPVDFVKNLSLFTIIIAVHNSFAATMDVAIDALACNVLPEHERGVANGFMFGGASVGQTIGGSMVLFLAAVMPFSMTYFFVIGVILLVTIFVVLPLREVARPAAAPVVGSKLAAVGLELKTFVVHAYRAFIGSQAAFVGVFSALLPLGAYALALALQSTLAVELGFTDSQVATLNLWSTVVFAVTCIAGGWISDRFGRRRTLALLHRLHRDPHALPGVGDAAPRLDPLDRRQRARTARRSRRRWCRRSGSPSCRTTCSRGCTTASAARCSWTSRRRRWRPRSSPPTWRCRTSPSRTRRAGRASRSRASATRRRWCSTASPGCCRSCCCRS